MRKFIIKKKKENVIVSNKRKKNSRIRNAALWILALGMLTGMGSTVYATEGEENSSYVYHKHAGSSESGGGCYAQPVYHVHEGSEEGGGICYETAIYHQHMGDTSSGGVCYGTAVYHEHNADWCYSTRHTHGSECYRLVSSDEYGCEIVDWWDTIDGDDHDSDYKYYVMSCGQTIHGTSAWHQHEELDCNGTGGTNERVLSCTKSGVVEGYRLSCSKTAETIDYYTLSCPKTTETIDSYERNCGKEEGIAYGKITLTKNLSEDGYSAVLNAVFEELNGGGLQLSDSGFSWYDSEGNCIGNGENITVSNNDTYSVTAGVSDGNSNGETVTASITVSDIRDYVEEIPEEIPNEQPKDDSWEDDGDESQSGRDDEDNQGEENTDEPEEDTDDSEENVDEEEHDDDEEDDDEEEAAGAKEEIAILPIPTEVPVLLETAPIMLEAQTVQEKNAETDKEETDEAEVKPTPTPVLKKQTVSVKMEEKKSDREEVAEIQTVEVKKTFFDSPVVKVITITAGTFAIITGLFVLGYLFRWSVAVYNDDGQGKLIYLGRAMVQNKEEGHTAVITDEMVQRAVTNRYCLKTGLFRFGRGEEELLIKKQSKRISHVIEKEIYVVI